MTPADISNSSDPIFPIFHVHTFYDKVCNTNRHLCNIRGSTRFAVLAEYGPSVRDASWSGCWQRCHDDIRCQSFSLGLEGICRLWRQRIADNLLLTTPREESHWDAGCTFVIGDYVSFLLFAFMKGRRVVKNDEGSYTSQVLLYRIPGFPPFPASLKEKD